MAATKYTYSVSGDTLNGVANAAALHYEIDETSTITIGVDHIEKAGDVLDVWMKAALSAGEETTLDGVVAAHTGAALPENAVQNVEVIEDRTFATEGTFQGCMWEWTIPSGTAGDVTKLTATQETNSQPIKFPFPISMLFASWSCTSDNDGDEGVFVAGEDTIVGTITSDIAVDDVTFAVSSTVTANVAKGTLIKIDSEQFGRAIAKSVGNGTITVETAATSTHTTGAYVKVTKEIARRIYFEAATGGCRFSFGGNRVGGSLLPANVECNLYYKNNGTASKKFRLYIEYVI